MKILYASECIEKKAKQKSQIKFLKKLKKIPPVILREICTKRSHSKWQCKCTCFTNTTT